MVAAPAAPDGRSEPLDGPQDLVPRLGPEAVLLPRLGVAARRERASCAIGSSTMASASAPRPATASRQVSPWSPPVRARRRTPSEAPSDVTDAIGSPPGICHGKPGSIGASPMPLAVISAARTSRFVSETRHRGLSCSSLPRRRLGGPCARLGRCPVGRLTRRRAPPAGPKGHCAALSRKGCLHACHSPSPRTSIPLPSPGRCDGLPEPRQGSCTASVSGERLLSSAGRREVRHRPVRAREPEQAGHGKARRTVVCRSGKPRTSIPLGTSLRDALPASGQPRLDGGVATDRLRAALARGRSMPRRRRIERSRPSRWWDLGDGLRA